MAKRRCKNGRRKDGKCRKTPKRRARRSGAKRKGRCLKWSKGRTRCMRRAKS